MKLKTQFAVPRNESDDLDYVKGAFFRINFK